ncbi:caspase-14-like isoform X1 [Astyanax mexicanus]|uniref:Caspase-14-like isoform X1 n=1 Tax=Astyanax mexicanus TaxID=7994 RepID=A0A8T2KPG4_ASTMX|nr:caspase-14-like isoform X1 [Astyanax mexicanus]
MAWSLSANFSKMKLVTIQDSYDYGAHETGHKREVLIICDLKRPGAWSDLKIMSQMFQDQGFVQYVEGRPTEQRLDATLQGFWRSLSYDGNVSGFVVVIMAHGSLGTISLPVYPEDYYNYDDYLRADFNPPKRSLESIFEKFNNRNCPAMRGKPRLFIVQACRGDGGLHQNTCGMIHTFDSNSMYVPSVPRRLTSMSEYVIVYATHPGKLAYRHPSKGCPLFIELEKAVNLHGLTMDILQLFTKVTNSLKQRQAWDCYELGITEQESSLHIVHELSRKWFLFNPDLPYIWGGFPEYNQY